MFQVNAAAAAELLDFARRAGVGRAVFGSTGTVYGAGPGNEDSFSRPPGYFAATKLFAVVSMAGGFGLFWYLTAPGPIFASIVAAVLVASALFVVTRPNA